MGREAWVSGMLQEALLQQALVEGCGKLSPEQGLAIP